MNMKQELAEAPVLGFPHFTKEFIITTDVSADGIGALMTQIGDDGKEHLLSYTIPLVILTPSGST
jgi:hypothetical protein